MDASRRYDGGRTLSWSGKVALIGGCTPSIDSHHAVIGSMGERFVMLRPPPVKPVDHARRALSHVGREATMRSELAGAARAVIDGAKPVEHDVAGDDRLIQLATLAVRCRSAVERDARTREIEYVPDAESPGRLALVLRRLLAGLAAIGADAATAWSLEAHGVDA